MDQDGQSPSVSPVLITLFKGVLYQDRSPELWQALLRLQAGVQEHAGIFGLELLQLLLGLP